MKVSEFGQARIANVAKVLSARNRIADVYGDAALAHVAILRFPTIAMIDHYSIAALATLQALPAGLVREGICHSVAPAFYSSIGSSKHGDLLFGLSRGLKAEVCPRVAFVSRASACVIANAWARVDIDIVLDEAGLAQLARDRL